jgi:glucokinase
MADPKLIQQRLASSSWGILGSQGYILGIDLGGYGLRIALIDLQNHIYTSVHHDIPSLQDAQSTLEQAQTLASKLLDEAGVETGHLVRIGVGFGGPVDPLQGVVLLSPRMRGWENLSVKDYFEKAFDTVTLVDNDANLIALGEATFGIGHACRDLFYLHLSSGVGGGIVLDGRLHHGATAMAGEIGHVVVRHGDDTSRQTMTLEELVSIDGLMRRAKEHGLSTDNLNDIFGDDPIARQVVYETIDLLGFRIAQVVALLDPQMVVLGGIVVRIGGEPFVQAIAERMNQYLAPIIARPVSLVASILGSDSIAVGALSMALESLKE